MPALTNPRWERFAQVLVAGIEGKPIPGSAAYLEAGYTAKPGNCAEVGASRLLRKIKPIAQRVAELQQAAANQAIRKKRRTLEGILDRIDRASDIAEEDRIPAAITAAEQAKAKLLGLVVDRTEQGKPGDFSDSNSTREIVDSVLKQANPDLESVTDEQRMMAGEEMARHARALQAIAAGDLASDPVRPQPARHAN